MKNFPIKIYLCSIVSLLLINIVNFAQSETERAILDELNKVRSNPQSYIAYLEEYKKLFKGKNVEYPDSIMLTFEGTKAVDEAIKFLRNAPKLEPFTFSTGLAKPAKLQLNDLLENYSLGHIGKDKSNLPKRIARFGKTGKLSAENIMNQVGNPKDIVMLLIIDDGLKQRGHRKNIFNKTFKEVGIAFGKGKNNDLITVMVFADSFVEKTK